MADVSAKRMGLMPAAAIPNEFGQFIERHESVLIQGPAGVGKSHLAHALGHEACRRGYDVLFIPAARMLGHLHGGRADGSYERRLLTYTRPTVDCGPDPTKRPPPSSMAVLL